MGFLKNLFGFGKPGPQAKPTTGRGGNGIPPRRLTSAPSDPNEDAAAETLRSGNQQEDDLRNGKPVQVESSNVAWIQWFDGQDRMHVGYLDGSVYQYEQMTWPEALSFLTAGSKGGFVWDNLRRRGTVFGYQKPYSLLDLGQGNRIWHEGLAGQRKKGKFISKAQHGLESRQRHGAVGPEGEPFKGWHPAFAHGKGGLGKKRGKRK